MNNPFAKVIDTARAPIEVIDVNEALNSVNPLAPVDDGIKAIADAASDTVSIVKSIPNQIVSLSDKLASGALDATSAAFRRANAQILGALDLSRTVLPGVKYKSMGGAASKIAGAINKVPGVGVPSQIPIPTIPIAKDTKSAFDGLPAWGSLESFRRMGLGTEFYWGLTLDNYTMDSVRSFAPDNPFLTNYDFNSSNNLNPLKSDSKYIPVVNYSFIWRTAKTSQLSINEFNVDLPSGFTFPTSISLDIPETDLYEWDLYLKEYYNILTGFEQASFPYKNCCSRIGLNIFYCTGAQYLQQVFYCIPDIRLEYSGQSSKGIKTYSMEWKIYGEDDPYLYEFKDLPRPNKSLLEA